VGAETPERVAEWADGLLGERCEIVKVLEREVHTYTRYRVFLYPVLVRVVGVVDVEGYFWEKLEDMERLPFSSGHKRVLQQIILFTECLALKKNIQTPILHQKRPPR
jgi:hypothetical protein